MEIHCLSVGSFSLMVSIFIVVSLTSIYMTFVLLRKNERETESERGKRESEIMSERGGDRKRHNQRGKTERENCHFVKLFDSETKNFEIDLQLDESNFT